MKKIKILSSILVLLLGLFQVSSIFSKDTTLVFALTENEPMIKYDFAYMEEDVEMPILGYMGVPGAAYSGVPTPGFLTRANIEAYKEAGFNIMSGLYEKVPLHTSEVRKALALCDELQLTYFVCDTAYLGYDYATKDAFKESMQSDFYWDYDSFGGIAVDDEPTIQYYDALANVSTALKELDETKVMYTNLYPKGASTSQLGLGVLETECTWTEYEKYVKDFVDKAKPIVLPYDCYVLTHLNAKVSDANDLGDEVGRYFKSLSLFRKESKEHNIPFWVTVASFNHIIYQTHIPLKQTSWTVNTSLAYGAKGIQYYTYWNELGSYSGIDAWANQTQERGLVSYNGARHDNYYKIQKINNNIKLIDHILMQADHKGVMQFGTQHVKLVQADVLSKFGLLKDITGDAFVGCFEYNGNDVYYIVNNSVDAGTTTFKANFTRPVNVNIVGQNNQTAQNPLGLVSKTDTRSVGFNLSGGEAVLLEVVR